MPHATRWSHTMWMLTRLGSTTRIRAPLSRLWTSSDDASAAGCLPNLAVNQKAEPAAAVLASGRTVALSEDLEEVALTLEGNSYSGIPNRKPQYNFVLVLTDETDPHRDLALVGELNRVAKKVGEHLA